MVYQKHHASKRPPDVILRRSFTRPSITLAVNWRPGNKATNGGKILNVPHSQTTWEWDLAKMSHSADIPFLWSCQWRCVYHDDQKKQQCLIQAEEEREEYKNFFTFFIHPVSWHTHTHTGKLGNRLGLSITIKLVTWPNSMFYKLPVMGFTAYITTNLSPGAIPLSQVDNIDPKFLAPMLYSTSISTVRVLITSRAIKHCMWGTRLATASTSLLFL